MLIYCFSGYLQLVGYLYKVSDYNFSRSPLGFTLRKFLLCFTNVMNFTITGLFIALINEFYKSALNTKTFILGCELHFLIHF